VWVEGDHGRGQLPLGCHLDRPPRDPLVTEMDTVEAPQGQRPPA
jgi:hypothetical protein